jgi:hypothetical protein
VIGLMEKMVGTQEKPYQKNCPVFFIGPMQTASTSTATFFPFVTSV